MVRLAALSAPISDSDQDTLAEPSTLLPVPPTVRVRAVPQLAVVMLAEPLKLVPLIVRAVVRVAALPVVFWVPAVFTPGRSMLALPLNETPPMVRAVAKVVAVAALPVIAMPHVPEAPVPVAMLPASEVAEMEPGKELLPLLSQMVAVLRTAQPPTQLSGEELT